MYSFSLARTEPIDSLFCPGQRGREQPDEDSFSRTNPPSGTSPSLTIRRFELLGQSERCSPSVWNCSRLQSIALRIQQDHHVEILTRVDLRNRIGCNDIHQSSGQRMKASIRVQRRYLLAKFSAIFQLLVEIVHVSVGVELFADGFTNPFECLLGLDSVILWLNLVFREQTRTVCERQGILTSGLNTHFLPCSMSKADFLSAHHRIHLSILPFELVWMWNRMIRTVRVCESFSLSPSVNCTLSLEIHFTKLCLYEEWENSSWVSTNKRCFADAKKQRMGKHSSCWIVSSTMERGERAERIDR